MANRGATAADVTTWADWCRQNLKQDLWLTENCVIIDTYTDASKNIIVTGNPYTTNIPRVYFLASVFDRDVNQIELSTSWGWPAGTKVDLIPLGGPIEAAGSGENQRVLSVDDMEHVVWHGILTVDALGWLKKGDVGIRDFGWIASLNTTRDTARMFSFEGNGTLTKSEAYGIGVKYGFSADRVDRSTNGNDLEVVRYNCFYVTADEGEGTYWGKTKDSTTSPTLSMDARDMVMFDRGAEGWQSQDGQTQSGSVNKVCRISLINPDTTWQRPFQFDQDYAAQIDVLQGDLDFENILVVGGKQSVTHFFSEDRSGRGFNNTGRLRLFNWKVLSAGNNFAAIHSSFQEHGPSLYVSNVDISQPNYNYNEIGKAIQDSQVRQGSNVNIGNDIQFMQITYDSGKTSFLEDDTDTKMYAFENQVVDVPVQMNEDIFNNHPFKGCPSTSERPRYKPYYGYNTSTEAFLEKGEYYTIESFTAGLNPLTHTRVNVTGINTDDHIINVTNVLIHGSTESGQNGEFAVSSIDLNGFEIPIPFTADGGNATLYAGEDTVNPISFVTDTYPSTNFTGSIVYDPKDNSKNYYFCKQANVGNVAGSKPEYDVNNNGLANGIEGTYWVLVQWDSNGYPSYHTNFNASNTPLVTEYYGDLRAKDGTQAAKDRIGVSTHWQDETQAQIRWEVTRTNGSGGPDESIIVELPGEWSESLDINKYPFIGSGDYIRQRVTTIDGGVVLPESVANWVLVP